MQTAQIYIASAGSGKTFTLVKEYLKILFRHAFHGDFHAYRNILAITFTNKASHEMKERIIKELTAIASGDNSNQLETLKNELPEILDFKNLADRILIKLLHDFSNFNVQTIDSFFQNIIRSFAKELDLPLNFEIILDKEDALQYAVDELIDQIGKDKQISDWLTRFAFSKIEDDKSWNFRENVLKLSKEVFNSSFNLSGSSFDIAELKTVKNKLDKEISIFEKTVNQLAEKALEVLVSIDYPDRGFSGNYVTKWLNKNTGKVSAKTCLPNATVTAQIKGEKSYYSKAFEKANQADIQSVEASSFFKIIGELYDYIEHNLGRFIANTEINRNVFSLGVIHTINRFIKEYRTQNNALFLLDATELLNGFIELENTPFLFEKLATKIQYLFIDEFQDTSTLQWTNLLPIIENILGSSERDLHLLLVGDAKQSIYRWRDGDYELLTYKAKESLNRYDIGDEILNTNYRSLPTIVNFNNQFFETTKSIANLSDDVDLSRAIDQIYQSQSQHQFKQSPNGKATVSIIQKNDEQTWFEIAQEKLLEDIGELKSLGYNLNDIAILVRKKKHGIELSRFLQNNGIEILSEETLLLQYNADIKLLIAGLYFAMDKHIPLFYTNFLWQIYKQIDPKNISKNDVFTDFIERKLMPQWLPTIDSITNKKLIVFDALEQLIQILKIDVVGNLFVNHFRQLVFDFLKNESGNIADFLEYWEKEKYRLSVSLKNGKDKINVLTIHKSKGLEFPVVLMPYCDWNFNERKQDNYLWVNDQHLHDEMLFPIRTVSDMESSHFAPAYLKEMRAAWIDNINLLYVALTRAKEVLHICCPYKKASASKPLPSTAAHFVIAALKHQNIEINETDDTFYEVGNFDGLPIESHEAVIENTSISLSQSPHQIGDLKLKKPFENNDIRIGNLVHKALEYLTSNKPNIAFEKALIDGDYSSYEIETAKQHFSKIISAENQFIDWVDNCLQTWDEQPIYYEGKMYRPDKIFRLKEKYVVVDYKTGVAQKQYVSKLKLYINALKALGIEEAVEGYILYSESASLEKV